MPKGKSSEILLEVVTPHGNQYYFRNPLLLIFSGQVVPYLEKMWGSEELLYKIVKDESIKAISTKGSGLILMKPFESVKWIDNSQIKPATEE